MVLPSTTGVSVTSFSAAVDAGENSASVFANAPDDAAHAKSMSAPSIWVPSDHLTPELIVYLTVRGSSLIFSKVP